MCQGSPDCQPFLEALKEKLPPPDRTLILRELIAEVCEARLKGWSRGERGEGQTAKRPWICPFALGRREEALIPAQEATEINRQLAQSNPAAFLPDLAMSLNNLGSILSELGRREEALDACPGGR